MTLSSKQKVSKKLFLLWAFLLGVTTTVSLFSPLAEVNAAGATTTTSAQSISSALSQAGLPIGNITAKTVQNPKGLVVYLPQVHLNPGTQPSDSANNTAVIAQNELYSITSNLVKNESLGFVMAEGDMYGPVPSDKISIIKSKIDARNSLSSAASELQNLSQSGNADQSLATKIASETSSVVQSADRNTILQGAPYKLKAEGGNFTLYGAENPTTYEQSADLVRRYIYLQDRMGQLSGGGAGSMRTSFDMSSIQSLVGNASPSSPIASDLKTLESESSQKGQSQAVAVAQKMETAIATLNSPDYQAPQTQNAPSRADNPYSSITDPNQISSMMQSLETQINATVIEQRNKETATNFAKALSETGNYAGILQFGAGHEDGIVPALNSQGLDVLIVTSREVLSTGTGQPQTASQPMQPVRQISQPAIPQMTRPTAQPSYGQYPTMTGAGASGVPSQISQNQMPAATRAQIQAMMSRRNSGTVAGTRTAPVSANSNQSQTQPQQRSYYVTRMPQQSAQSYQTYLNNWSRINMLPRSGPAGLRIGL